MGKTREIPTTGDAFPVFTDWLEKSIEIRGMSDFMDDFDGSSPSLYSWLHDFPVDRGNDPFGVPGAWYFSGKWQWTDGEKLALLAGKIRHMLESDLALLPALHILVLYWLETFELWTSGERKPGENRERLHGLVDSLDDGVVAGLLETLFHGRDLSQRGDGDDVAF